VKGYLIVFVIAACFVLLTYATFRSVYVTFNITMSTSNKCSSCT